MGTTRFTALRTSLGVVIGTTLAVGGFITGTQFSAPAGSDTVIDAPSGQDIVYTLNGTELRRDISPATLTATGGNVKYDAFYLPSSLTTTGAIRSLSIQCGNVAKALVGDLGFVKAAGTQTGSVFPNFENVTIGSGSYIYLHTGATLWNPADKIKFGTLTTPTGTLNATRYDCILRATVEDIYGR